MNNLLLKHIQILVGLMLLTGDDFVATAEIAEFMAKRDMHVQRGTLRIAGYRRIKFSGAKFWRKLQRGGIRSITRPGIVIFLIRARSQSINCTDMLTPSDGTVGGYAAPAQPHLG